MKTTARAPQQIAPTITVYREFTIETRPAAKNTGEEPDAFSSVAMRGTEPVYGCFHVGTEGECIEKMRGKIDGHTQPPKFAFFDQFTEEQMRAQYGKNAEVFKKMTARARAIAPKKYSGYTLEQLEKLQARYEWLSENYKK